MKPTFKTCSIKKRHWLCNNSQLEGASVSRLESIRILNGEDDGSQHLRHCGVADNCNPIPWSDLER